MTARQSREVGLALAYLQRTGCKPAVAAARYKVDVGSVRRAMRRAEIPVALPGRPPRPTSAP